jgi:hypothetical protein
MFSIEIYKFSTLTCNINYDYNYLSLATILTFLKHKSSDLILFPSSVVTEESPLFSKVR